MDGLVTVADDHGRRGVHDIDDFCAVCGVAVAIREVPVNEHGFKTRTDDVGEDALYHHKNIVGATRVERRRRHGHPAGAALHGGNWRAIDDGWINVAQYDDIKRAGGAVA